MEILVVLAVALVVVGPKRLPELGKTIGKSLREFRKAQDDLRRSIEFDIDDDAAPPSRRSGGPMSRGSRGRDPDEDDEPGKGPAEARVDDADEPSLAEATASHADSDADNDDDDDGDVPSPREPASRPPTSVDPG
ncbi:MAG: twin-arginine translocase TatA/TatE family subunit [Actinomycetota bacterium]